LIQFLDFVGGFVTTASVRKFIKNYHPLYFHLSADICGALGASSSGCTGPNNTWPVIGRVGPTRARVTKQAGGTASI
jgi:hypothetical protein